MKTERKWEVEIHLRTENHAINRQKKTTLF